MILFMMHYAYEESLTSAVVFSLLCFVFMFFVFIEKKSITKDDSLKKEIDQLKADVTSISIKLGWG